MLEVFLPVRSRMVKLKPFKRSSGGRLQWMAILFLEIALTFGVAGATAMGLMTPESGPLWFGMAGVFGITGIVVWFWSRHVQQQAHGPATTQQGHGNISVPGSHNTISTVGVAPSPADRTDASTRAARAELRTVLQAGNLLERDLRGLVAKGSLNRGQVTPAHPGFAGDWLAKVEGWEETALSAIRRGWDEGHFIIGSGVPVLSMRDLQGTRWTIVLADYVAGRLGRLERYLTLARTDASVTVEPRVTPDTPTVATAPTLADTDSNAPDLARGPEPTKAEIRARAELYLAQHRDIFGKSPYYGLEQAMLHAKDHLRQERGFAVVSRYPEGSEDDE